MMTPTEPPSALQEFKNNLRAAPRRIYETAFRGGPPTTDRTRSTFIFSNGFLHLHSLRVHRWTLRWSTSMGLGVASTAAFLITLITGVLLMFYCKPYPDAAYQSIKDIHFVVPTGRFMRNIHRWAANVMGITVMPHMARAFYTAAYRKPREFNWLMGMGLLALTLGFSFTGYLLPWDQLAYWAIPIGANIAQSPPEVTDAIGVTEIFDPGGMQRFLLLGSETVGGGGSNPLLSAARDDSAAGAGHADVGAFLPHPEGRRTPTSDWGRRRARRIRYSHRSRRRPIRSRRLCREGRRRWGRGRRIRGHPDRVCSTPN